MLAVYEIDEPDPTANISAISPKRGWTLKFPNAPFDCESLFIWKDYGYVISKVFNKAHAQIFRFPLQDTTEPQMLELVATTKIESPVTGADISADGNLLGLVAKDGAYVYRINGDVARVNEVAPHHTKIKDQHIEGCCFVPDGLLATSERAGSFCLPSGVSRAVRRDQIRNGNPRRAYTTSMSIFEASDFFSFDRISASNFRGSILRASSYDLGPIPESHGTKHNVAMRKLSHS